MDKVLLNIEDLCNYLSIGKSHARQLLHKKDNKYTIQIGNRLYAHKPNLDKYLEDCANNNEKVL